MQTVSEGVDVGVQCSLLPGPPLTLLKDPNDSTTEEVEEDLESSMSDSSYIVEDSDESRTEHTGKVSIGKPSIYFSTK